MMLEMRTLVEDHILERYPFSPISVGSINPMILFLCHIVKMILFRVVGMAAPWVESSTHRTSLSQRTRDKTSEVGS